MCCTQEKTANLIEIINKIPEDQNREPALKTLDKKYSLQWSVLKDLIHTKSKETMDSVIDCWFAIWFGALFPSTFIDVKTAMLPTLASGLLDWQDEDLFKEMVSSISGELLVDNYWHLLESLYIPLCIHLEKEDHWILLRVLIGKRQSHIEIYDSLRVGLCNGIYYYRYYPLL